MVPSRPTNYHHQLICAHAGLPFAAHDAREGVRGCDVRMRLFSDLKVACCQIGGSAFWVALMERVQLMRKLDELRKQFPEATARDLVPRWKRIFCWLCLRPVLSRSVFGAVRMQGSCVGVVACSVSTIRPGELAVSPWERRKRRKPESMHKKRRRKHSKRRRERAKEKARRRASGEQSKERPSGARRRQEHMRAAMAEQRIRRSTSNR